MFTPESANWLLDMLLKSALLLALAGLATRAAGLPCCSDL